MAVGLKLDPLIVSVNDKYSCPVFISSLKLRNSGEVVSGVYWVTESGSIILTSVRLFPLVSLTAWDEIVRLLLDARDAKLGSDLMTFKSSSPSRIVKVAMGGARGRFVLVMVKVSLYSPTRAMSEVRRNSWLMVSENVKVRKPAPLMSKLKDSSSGSVVSGINSYGKRGVSLTNGTASFPYTS